MEAGKLVDMPCKGESTCAAPIKVDGEQSEASPWDMGSAEGRRATDGSGRALGVSLRNPRTQRQHAVPSVFIVAVAARLWSEAPLLGDHQA
jgi:hypothetical protein